MEQGISKRQTFESEDRTFNGVMFSARCMETIDEMSKHPQSTCKAIRKAIKDVFTNEELRSQTPAGCGRENRARMDEKRLKAVRGNLLKS